MSVFIITELRRTGAGIGEPTGTVLRWTSAERSAPRGVIECALAIKTVREEVPGSEEPVEQVVSATWQPFELEGVWDDRYAGSGFAARAEREFAQLAKRAPLVRLQLDQWSMVGLITEFRPGYLTRDRRRWAFTLSPHRNESVGEVRPVSTAPAVRPVVRHVAVAEALTASIANGHAAAAAIPLATELHADAGEDTHALSAITAKLSAASAAGFEQDATQRLLGISSLFRAVRGAAQAIPERFARARSTTQVAFNDVIQTLRFEAWARTAASDARRAVWGSEQASRDLRVQARQRPRAIHRARAGESLQRIAQLYYGDPAGWRDIYAANGLSSLTLLGTEDLVIPERRR